MIQTTSKQATQQQHNNNLLFLALSRSIESYFLFWKVTNHLSVGVENFQMSPRTKFEISQFACCFGDLYFFFFFPRFLFFPSEFSFPVSSPPSSPFVLVLCSPRPTFLSFSPLKAKNQANPRLLSLPNQRLHTDMEATRTAARPTTLRENNGQLPVRACACACGTLLVGCFVWS